MIERIKVWAEATTIYIDYQTLKDVRESMDRWIETYGEDARIESRQYEYEDGEYLAIMVEREETDVEYHRRVKSLEAQRAYYEERDRKEFERLKEKFKDN